MLTRLCLILALAQAQSCCTLFALLGCGTGVPLTPVSWDSPKKALTTFLTAIRASDTKVIYEALSEDFKARSGLDGLTVAVLWERLREQVPAVHLLGDAEVVKHAGGREEQRFELSVYGYRLEVTVQPTPYWEAGLWDETFHEFVEPGEYVESKRDVIQTVEGSRVTVFVDNPMLLGYPREQISYIKAGVAWKVASLRQLQSK